jgi:hypothetical protein
MKTAMKNVFLAASLAASLAALAIPVVAQATGSAAGSKSPSPKPTVQQRKKHPQKHIAHGVQKRHRTAGEAASLERKEAGASTEERNIREDNHGRLTSANRARLQHRQNHVSKAIDHKKHNAVVSRAHARTAPEQRPQQHRSAQLKTGQLTTRQAAHLETKETSLRHQIHSDREQDAGKLTPEDQTNPQQDKSTNQIHLKEHNARMF